MSTFISPLASQFVATDRSGGTQRQTGAFSVPTRPFSHDVAEASLQVNISIEGQQRAGKEPQQEVERHTFKQGSFAPIMLEALSKHEDDAGVHNYLKQAVYEDTLGPESERVVGGLLDLTDYLKGGPMRYSSGELVTAESNAYFTRAEQEYRSQKIELYENELRKGTPPLEIFEKLADLTSQQPTSFLRMKGYIA